MEKRYNLKKTAVLGLFCTLLGVSFLGCERKKRVYPESEHEYQTRLAKEKRAREKKGSHEDAARLKKKARKLKKKTQNKAEKLKEGATTKGHQIAETLRDKASAAKNTVKSAFNNLQNKTVSAFNHIKGGVKGAQDNNKDESNEHNHSKSSPGAKESAKKGSHSSSEDVRGAADLAKSNQGKNSVVSIKIDSFKKLSGEVSADEVYISCPKGYEDSIVKYLDISTSRLVINDHEYHN